MDGSSAAFQADLERFAACVQSGSCADASELIAYRPRLLSCEDYADRSTPRHKTWLHLAADSGRIEMVELLLKHGMAVDVEDDDGCTPLHVALTVRACDSSVAVLLRHGADPNHQVNDVWPIHVAAGKNDGTENLRALIQHGASLEAQGEITLPPLFVAASQGCVENVRILLAAGANAYHERRGVPLVDTLCQQHQQAAQQLIRAWIDADVAHKAVLAIPAREDLRSINPLTFRV